MVQYNHLSICFSGIRNTCFVSFSIKVKLWSSTTTNSSVLQLFDTFVLHVSFSMKVKPWFSTTINASVLEEFDMLLFYPFPRK